MYKVYIKKITFLILFLHLTSCNPEQKEISKELNEKLASTIENLTKNPNQPIEEIQKLYQLEYKVITLPLETKDQDIENKLNEIGLKRWDCSSIVARPRTSPTPPELLIICKRTPETVLRFVPKTIIGR